MKRYLLIIIASLFLCSSSSYGNQTKPTEDLKPVLDELTAVLADESLKGKEHLTERRKKIMSQIKQGFDFMEMSKRVLGKTWRKIDESQRQHFTELMTKLLENVYIGKLEGYSGVELEYAGEIIKGKRAQVTTLIENEGATLQIHYIMSQGESRWMVYNIIIEGVSLVGNYKQQFKPILRKEKYEGLVKVLEEKNRSFFEGQK